MKLHISDQEILTQCTWQELIEQAQNAHTPYLQVSVTHTTNPQTGNKIYHFYDAISFDHYVSLDARRKDPLSNLPIEKIEHRYIKIANFNIRKRQLEQVKPTKSVTLSKNVPQNIPQETETWQKIFRDATDYHLCPGSKGHVANCQYLYGTHLLVSAVTESAHRQKLQAALHWIFSAVAASHKPAEKTFELAYQHLFPKKHKW